QRATGDSPGLPPVIRSRHRGLVAAREAPIDPRRMAYRQGQPRKPCHEQPQWSFVHEQHDGQGCRKRVSEEASQRRTVQLGVLERPQAAPVTLLGIAQPQYLQRRQAQRQLGEIGVIARHRARVAREWLWPGKVRRTRVVNRYGYSTVTDFARFRGWSTSVPFTQAV